MATIGFVGAGNMAEAILSGILKNGFYAPQDVTMSDPAGERLERLKTKYGVAVTGDNDEVGQNCDVVVLAIKPQMASAVLTPMKTGNKGQLFISILAGMTTLKIEKFFSEKIKLVRAMPNTPLMVGRGCTALCTGASAGDEEMAVAKGIFGSAGFAFEAQEKQMDLITAISGSGPAYFYMIFEAIADAGVYSGLPRDLALSLAVCTAEGAARMVTETGTSPADLKAMVTSPGGTTIAAIKTLEEHGIRAAFMDAVDQAIAKASELDT